MNLSMKGEIRFEDHISIAYFRTNREIIIGEEEMCDSACVQIHTNKTKSNCILGSLYLKKSTGRNSSKQDFDQPSFFAT